MIERPVPAESHLGSDDNQVQSRPMATLFSDQRHSTKRLTALLCGFAAVCLLALIVTFTARQEGTTQSITPARYSHR